jgi:hypothetical protein
MYKQLDLAGEERETERQRDRDRDRDILDRELIKN